MLFPSICVDIWRLQLAASRSDRQVARAAVEFRKVYSN